MYTMGGGAFHSCVVCCKIQFDKRLFVCDYLCELGQVYQVIEGGGAPSVMHRMVLLPTSDKDMILGGAKHTITGEYSNL